MAVRTLAIDCATEACSAALFEGTELIDHRYEVLGRGHAERLVPMIAELPHKGRAGRILVSLGPGSFTGVRIGLAAARALGIAWHAQVLGYPTLHLVAQTARQAQPGPVTVCMAGGHGEYFVQNFDAERAAEDDVQSLHPESAVMACRHQLIVGSRAEELAGKCGGGRTAIAHLPDARQAIVLPETHLTSSLAPIYGRAPDARLPETRR